MHLEKLERAAGWVICVIGSAIMLWLTWNAFHNTQYLDVYGDEIPINVSDTRLRNLLILAAAAGITTLLYLMEQKCSKRVQHAVMYVTLAAAMLWIGLAGLWWVTDVDRQPVADQAYVYAGASYFLEGNYTLLSAGAYFGECPQNLGITAVIELFFLIVGPKNYLACQLANVVMVVGIIGMGFLIVRTWTEHTGIAVAYNLLMAACLPLIFYTSWVYGDVPGIFGMTVCIWGLLKYAKSGRARFLVLMVAAVTFAYIMRKHTLILIIALALTGGVYVLVRRDRKLALALVLAVLLPLLSYSGILKMYELRCGHELSKGFSNISYIVMGITEAEGKFGGYTEYCKEVYHEADCDTAKADEVSREALEYMLKYYSIYPSYAAYFLRRKLLNQWNMPLYQSLFSGYSVMGELEAEETSLAYQIPWKYFTNILTFCDRLQMVVYAGATLYFLLGVRKRGLLKQVSAVTIIGGFLFSVIWESKARYVFPYYLLMFPLAAIGWRLALEQVLPVLGSPRVRDMRGKIACFFRKKSL